MNTWSLKEMLHDVHAEIKQRLDSTRRVMGHAVAKGDSSEAIWLGILQTYLPFRYQVSRAFVIDSKGVSSDQLDIVIYDRQYTPPIFEREGQKVIPAESVYAIFEAKQSINAAQVAYAQSKAASVRALHRTSLPVPHVEGTAAPKLLHHILGGLLTLESEWTPPMAGPLLNALGATNDLGRLDLGCVAAHGMFQIETDGTYRFTGGEAPGTAFIIELIARLQAVATVPMIDARAYAAWL